MDFAIFKPSMKVRLQEMEKQNSALYQQNQKMLKLQESITLNLGTLSQQASSYVGNAYRTYETAVTAIEDKYNATADWGVTLTGNIIDLRAVFIIQNGVRVTAAEDVDDASKELEWAEAWLAHNKLDRELIHEVAKEAEIEGKIAFKLAPEKITGPDDKEVVKVKLRYISWTETKYSILTSPEDYMNYVALVWTPLAGEEQKLLPDRFVYSKFGGRLNKPNQAQPKIMKCLTQIDDVDRALRDWREINNLFAAPVPDVECDDDEAAKDARTALNDFNMKIGKAFIHAKSKFTFVGPPIDGMDSLLKEIETKIKIIAGNTSIPIHYLGLLDLLKNRATGESTRDVVIAGTTKERDIWKGTIQEALEKSMMIFNKEVNAKMSNQRRLDPSKVNVDIPVFTEDQWNHLETVLLPLYLGGGLSIEYLLSKIPDMNVEKELDRMDKKKEDDADRLERENQGLKDEARINQLTGGIAGGGEEVS
jgi:hypothetical protein